MHIAKCYITPSATALLSTSSLAQCAYNEICSSVTNMISQINNTSKNCNGVVPIKESCYQLLEETYLWYREKPLDTLVKIGKGGPIDVYKQFHSANEQFNVGLEFETGNISSAHRSMNKLHLGILNNELQLAVLLLPIAKLSYYLTDRVSNYEELEPYFSLVQNSPFIFIGFDTENYNQTVPFLPKGKDGMSKRTIRKWETPSK